MTQSKNIEDGADFAASKGLQYLIRPPRETSHPQKAIILLHGAGSNEQDLFRLSGQLPDDVYVIAPRGPFTLGDGRYAWYNVDFSTGRPVINAEQETLSRKLILAFIGQLKQKYQIGEVYLGGFSQGAIMSYGIGLTNPNEAQAIISLSGRILDEIRPLIHAGVNLQKLAVFVAHGIQDNTLPIHYARAAKELLENLEVKLTYQEYPIGHQISNDVLKDLNNWLNSH